MPNEIVPIIFFMSTAAVLIFRPLTTRIGRTIEQSRADKKAAPDPQISRIMQLMERLVDRMDRLEDRVDFTERVLERQRVQAQLTEGPGGAEPETMRHDRRAGSDEIL